MEFIVSNSLSCIHKSNVFALITDNWDDWFTYQTMYTLVFINNSHNVMNIGSVKIGELNLDKGKPNIPTNFKKLNDNFFSLGQISDYYTNLTKLGDDVRDEVLKSLNDIAFDNNLYSTFKNEEVMRISLMRDIAQTTVLGQYNRLAHGKAKLSEYNFGYKLIKSYEWEEDIDLVFSVKPNSLPPTNIHVIIGRNGVGKTYLLTKMINSILENTGDFYENNYQTEERDSQKIFAGLVFVSFSAFDYEIPMEKNGEGIYYNYIGLKQRDKDTNNIYNKKVEDLTKEFVKVLEECYLNSRINLWKDIISLLDSDPIFKENNISGLLDIENFNGRNSNPNKIQSIIEKSSKVFEVLSSGHKIVLLTLSSLIARVEERTLVLMDEPEVHLHPPLLAAFIRAISELLITRNGVAIVATHSPVVLQVVPKSCVWKLRRYGSNIKVERLGIECFGENLGVLTSEVFRHEVTNSGVYKLLKDIVDEDDYSFEEVMELFNNKLGFEAQAILRVLLSNKDEEENNEKDL